MLNARPGLPEGREAAACLEVLRVPPRPSLPLGTAWSLPLGCSWEVEENVLACCSESCFAAQVFAIPVGYFPLLYEKRVRTTRLLATQAVGVCCGMMASGKLWERGALLL